MVGENNGSNIKPPRLVPAPPPNGVPESAKISHWQNGEWVTTDSETQPLTAVNPKADPTRQYDPEHQETWPMEIIDLAKEINEQERQMGKLHSIHNEPTRPMPAVKPVSQHVPGGDVTRPVPAVNPGTDTRPSNK